ncbi:MAG: hypothetical protein ACO1QR_08850 [Chthoniobacteraceae bacterium]
MWKVLRRSFSFWFGLAMVVSSLGVLPQMFAAKAEWERFLRDGRVTDAPVLERRSEHDEFGTQKYFLEIQYYDEQMNQYPKDLRVNEELFEKFRRGSVLPVRYLANAPETMIPEPLIQNPQWKETQRTAYTAGMLGGVVLLLAALRMIRMVRA